MATLTIEGVPPELLARLHCTALANGRCVNSEIILSLVRYVREAAPGGTGAAAPVSCPLAWRRPRASRRECNVAWGEPG